MDFLHNHLEKIFHKQFQVFQLDSNPFSFHNKSTRQSILAEKNKTIMTTLKSFIFPRKKNLFLLIDLIKELEKVSKVLQNLILFDKQRQQNQPCLWNLVSKQITLLKNHSYICSNRFN
jgi:hypothetical protein